MFAAQVTEENKKEIAKIYKLKEIVNTKQIPHFVTPTHS